MKALNKTLIKNVRIPMPNAKIRRGDILFTEAKGKVRGKILEIAEKIDDKNARIIDGEGDLVLPGFSDLYSDIYQSDHPERESIESGTLGARWGGYSDINIPIPEKAEQAAAELAENTAHCRISFSRSLEEGVSADKKAVYCMTDITFGNAKILRELMISAQKSDSLLILSPRTDPLYPNSCITEGRSSLMMNLPSEPASAEVRSVFEYLMLARETGCRIHIRSVSTKSSIELIKEAKLRGVAISASTSPQYFSLACKDVIFIGSNAKVYPPLREEADRLAVIEALRDGTIDCIDSGHAPRTKSEKPSDIRSAEYGAIGLQSTFCAAVTYLLIPGHIDIYRLCELLSYAPAKILGSKINYVDENCNAFCLASLSNEFIFSENYLRGKSTNSPFINMSMCGNIRENFIL